MKKTSKRSILDGLVSVMHEGVYSYSNMTVFLFLVFYKKFKF